MVHPLAPESTQLTTAVQRSSGVSGTIPQWLGADTFPRMYQFSQCETRLSGTLPSSIQHWKLDSGLSSTLEQVIFQCLMGQDANANQDANAGQQQIAIASVFASEFNVRYNQTGFYLSASNNRLSGVLPDLSHLSTMQSLYLERNAFSGTLSGFPRDLDLFLGTGNWVSGSIPDFDETNIMELNLAENDLSGTMSKSPLSLTNLNIGDNFISGSLTSFQQHKVLKVLWIGGNLLSGRLQAFANMSDSKTDSKRRKGCSATHGLLLFSATDNNFNSDLSGFGADCMPDLLGILVSSNRLFGTLPESMLQGPIETLLMRGSQ